MKHSVSLTWVNVSGRCGFPRAEELRMLRAIAQTAVSEAGRHGEYRAAFRGFRIYAVRWSAPFGHYVAIEVAYGSARGVLIAPVRPEDHDALLTEECYEWFGARAVESIALTRVI